VIDGAHPLLLGSASQRRRDILASLGLPLRLTRAEADETGRPGETPDAYIERITAAKLSAVAASGAAVGAGAILVADTVVVCDGRALGKPADQADARAMLRALEGKDHHVWTRFAIASPADPFLALEARTVRTRVTFRPLSEAEIADYAATGEGMDKAGAYAIQGIGAFAVAGIEGSYSNVVGLPACEVIAALRGTGLLGRFPLPPP
jgi:septum formation protein